MYKDYENKKNKVLKSSQNQHLALSKLYPEPGSNRHGCYPTGV